MTLMLNEKVKYTSIAGPVFDAIITRLHDDGSVDLAVDIRTKEPYDLHRVAANRITKSLPQFSS